MQIKYRIGIMPGPWPGGPPGEGVPALLEFITEKAEDFSMFA